MRSGARWSSSVGGSSRPTAPSSSPPRGRRRPSPAGRSSSPSATIRSRRSRSSERTIPTARASVRSSAAESFQRVVTAYLPDGREPQLPNVIGEGAASLLPDEDRPALLWTIDLDPEGVTTAAQLERATVRSRRALTYVEAQRELDHGR